MSNENSEMAGPENYERYFVPAIGGPMAKDLIEVASLAKGERVLDVACGTGVVARLAAEEVGAEGSAAGLDSYSCMLDVARTATPSKTSIDWHEASAEKLPFDDGAFDVVLCQMGLQFFSDKVTALQEMRRVLASGGRAIVNVPGPTPTMFEHMADGLTRHIDPQAGGFAHLVFSLHDADTLREMFDAAGFSEVDVQTTTKELTLPPPREFLWQYVKSTPLASMVGGAPEDRRAALESEVCEKWDTLVKDGELVLPLGVTTVTARK